MRELGLPVLGLQTWVCTALLLFSSDPLPDSTGRKYIRVRQKEI